MDKELQLKLQAYFDGEISRGEMRRIEEHLALDAEARALLAELGDTAQALAGFEAEVCLPESREFFWSKVQREIERQARPLRPHVQPSLWAAWRRWLASAGIVALVAVVGVLVTRPGLIATAQADIADSGAFTYRDFADRTTLVWLSYPAENELADREPSDTME